MLLLKFLALTRPLIWTLTAQTRLLTPPLTSYFYCFSYRDITSPARNSLTLKSWPLLTLRWVRPSCQNKYLCMLVFWQTIFIKVGHVLLHRWRAKVYIRPWGSWICCLTTLRPIWLPNVTENTWPPFEDLLNLISSEQEDALSSIPSMTFSGPVLQHVFYELSELSLLFWDLRLLVCPKDRFPNHIVSYMWKTKLN